MTFTLTEGAVAPTKTSTGSWKAVLITPGKGSSGIYSESMLRESGPAAFPKGTHSYIDHPTSDGEIRSPKNLMGVLTENAHYEDGIGLVAELSVMPHWKAFVEAVAPHTGLSIYAMGEGARNEDGDIVVESLIPHPQVSVDLVSYAGRPGSGLAEKLYESALAAFDSSKVEVNEADTVPPTDKGTSTMDPLEEIKGMIAELPALIAAAVVDALNNNNNDNNNNDNSNDNSNDNNSNDNVSAMNSAEPLDIAAIAEAMLAANLPEVSRKAVYESLRSGVDIAVAIEGQKAFVESVMSHLKESASAVAATASNETVILNTVEAKKSFRDILNITKVG